MRVVQPAYKPALILTILERLERGRQDAEASIESDSALAAAFDLLLLRVGAYQGPGRIFQPLRHLAVRRGSMPDQLWQIHGARVAFTPEFLPIVLSSEGRAWLRELIAERLRSGAAWRGVPEARRLATLVAGGTRSQTPGFPELAEQWEGRAAARIAELKDAGEPAVLPALARLGLMLEPSHGRWKILEGDAETGAAILSRIATADFDMTFLTTSVTRRQGQRVFAHEVLANFDGWCAFCPIQLQPLVEAAHLKTVAAFPEVGLDPQNGLALCRNHHGAFDSWLLGINGSAILRAPHLASEGANGLLSPLLRRVRAPHFPLRDHALTWRRDEFARRRSAG